VARLANVAGCCVVAGGLAARWCLGGDGGSSMVKLYVRARAAAGLDEV
jgi:hypothetical protein